MAKLFFTFASVLMCLATTVKCTNSKFVKTVPTITNSLVNLGKMEIAFYFNGKHPEGLSKQPNSVFMSNVPTTKSQALEAACPCSSFKNSKDSFFSEPSDLINKILRSKDLFRDPTSIHCCDSHEQVQESTVFFELGPNHAPMTLNNLKNPLNTMKIPRFQKVMNSPSEMFPMRPKAMEIFLFPKRKDIASMDISKIVTKPAIAKAEIQVVGDKEIKPMKEEAPPNEGASVKKDLTSLLEKNKLDDDSGLKSETSDTNFNNAL